MGTCSSKKHSQQAAQDPAAAPAAMAAPEPSPAVSDPAPAGEPTESEMTAQKIQKKKKGMKKNILTGVAGLGGEAPTYTTILS